jgi:hypothetical protein
MMRRRDEMDRKFTLQDVLGAVVFTLLMYSFAFAIALTN